MLRLVKKPAKSPDEMSFLDHLESLRWHIVRSVIVVLLLAIVAFINDDFVFGKVIFGPKDVNFPTYRWLCALAPIVKVDGLCITAITFKLQNLEMSGQFTMHMWGSFVAGLIVGAPYVLWELWRFIKPALRVKERRSATSFIFFASLLFITGVLFSYYVLAPLTINFLGNYHLTSDTGAVLNNITLDSYISTITTLTLLTGLVFELPIIVYFLTRFGIMTPAFMRRHRKHAVIVILIVAAIITPSSDVFTQMAVALPIYFLYELSIFVSAYVLRKMDRELNS
jgi:sec-independent protein translocase protein TatC